ncbi:Uncharacterized conserved protein YcfJ, contains glycine zipper 2TM domain [Fontimonas thermophila]|uniref:Uncharacterized conserved protein YcfJ, contains glycine zipper 2TM domain n=1 Tax=Fontimonas thermophila TaxID=1076937 RepID=A0A1I2HUF1_9GAMM|nr:glycine zipper 2TM domain-containing protein [Fontimonas thermophila]SFF33238.1 Uncharacterized conserved protein YcfJ, contains glycine zipper 2TM domain [Fontimonas thermophila]
MNRSMPGVIAMAIALAAPLAHADHRRYEDIEYAKVIRATPIYRSVRIEEPLRECWDERVVYPGRGGYWTDSGTSGALIGAIAGGVAGHQFGKGRGRDAATAVGALIGASIGHQIAVQHTPPVRERIGYERRCSTAYETRYEERIEGYDVTYRYNGRLYHTRMPYDPGDRIAIRVDVRPVGYARY